MQSTHKRIELTKLEKKPCIFGTCEHKPIEHSMRENEYYDEISNKAYCTACAIEITQN